VSKRGRPWGSLGKVQNAKKGQRKFVNRRDRRGIGVPEERKSKGFQEGREEGEFTETKDAAPPVMYRRKGSAIRARKKKPARKKFP